jgi:tRNA pseudouridine55 synthase
MQKVLNLFKPVGMTPLDVIKEFQNQNPEYQNVKLGYAGRLDPMAEGILLVLVCEENLKRKEYELLPKTYEFTIALGLETDTYDILGILQKKTLQPYDKEKMKSEIEKLIPKYIGKHIQEYPPYSSPRVNGKPLFYWAREGRLDEIEIPKKEIRIYNFQLNSEKSISTSDLQEYIFERINKVKGEFRQQEIKNTWNEFFDKNNESISTFTFTIECSSGTYIRSITHELGKNLGTNAIALQINRIKVGEFTIENSLKIF